MNRVLRLARRIGAVVAEGSYAQRRIVTINAWNAIAVSSRAWVPGSYQP
jgi:hypothetical protein